ncbi:la-related protein 7 [Ceratitis capitata]|uniref:La-related protein 7 n=1 Tax=Ceratitis capitata TaxID=7213 RepID=W8CAJ0_CERCA|nr:la-related protein 7 [Ceratitis capitata]
MESDSIDTPNMEEEPISKKNSQKKQKTPVAAEAAGDTTGGPKNHRKRKRHHFNAIRAQMEFYFGDANLSKDRFLKQLIDKDPYVPLEVFLNFNKLKALTTSGAEIAKSLSNSELLELDEEKLKVRRKTALPVERNVDDKTLYVEALPAAADHDWVRQAFERFGPVVYVSLPKYAKSRKIKEFGFVEFEQASSVEKAIKAFQEFNGVLRMQETDPAELQSVKSFIKEQNEDVADGNDESETEQKKLKKLKRGVAALVVDEGPEPKKVKTEDEDSTANETGETTNDEIEVQQQDNEDGSTKKKRRKKKKKTKNLEKRRKDTDLNTDASFYELKILPKCDWKRLRNKYLNLQREKVAELKRKAWKERQQQHQQASKGMCSEAMDTSAPLPTKKQKPKERKLRKMNMNFYGAGEEETKPQPKEIKQNPALERAPLFSYSEGLIVEVGFLNPCVNVKEFKADMRQYETVKYVDVKEGAINAHLRLDSAKAATDFVNQVNCAEYKCKVLSGEVELEYWKKIEKDREMKLNKQVKVPQRRGREKVKKLITKHIRFGEEEE